MQDYIKNYLQTESIQETLKKIKDLNKKEKKKTPERIEYLNAKEVALKEHLLKLAQEEEDLLGKEVVQWDAQRDGDFYTFKSEANHLKYIVGESMVTSCTLENIIQGQAYCWKP